MELTLISKRDTINAIKANRGIDPVEIVKNMRVVAIADVSNLTPTISRPKGKWKFIDDFGARMCSKCGRKSPYSDNFCPSCGAVMENGRNYEQFKESIISAEMESE